MAEREKAGSCGKYSVEAMMMMMIRVMGYGRSPRTTGMVRFLCLSLALLLLTAVSGTALAASDKKQANFDVRLGQRLYPRAVERGGAEVRLGGHDTRLVRTVFGDLADQARRQYSLPYSLHVMSSTSKIDAWAYPDGSVYLTLGLLRTLQRESELAGIIAHQLAHAALRIGVRAVKTEDLVLLEAVANGKLSPTDKSLGKVLVAVAAEYATVEDERQADDLALDFMRRAGFDRDGLSRAWGRIVAQDPKSPVLRAHPHPDAKLVHEPAPVVSAPVIIVPAPAPPPPPPSPPPPSYGSGGIVIVPNPPPPSPPPSPAPTPGVEPLRIERERRGSVAFDLGFGVFPMNFEAKDLDLSYDDGTDNYVLPINQVAADSTGVVRMDVDVATGSGFVFSFGGGGGGAAPLFTGVGSTVLGFVEGGVGQRLVDTRAFRLTVGGFVSAAWLSAPVYTVPGVPDYSGWMQVGDYELDAGTAVTANAASFGAGVRGKAAGALASGLEWHGSVQYQMMSRGSFTFSATDWAGEKVTIPFAGTGPDPFQPSGLSYSVGIGFRF